MKTLRIAVVAGGTGGHILPALVLFKRLKASPEVEAVRFLCRKADAGLTKKLGEVGADLVTVSGSGMPRKAGLKFLRFVIDLFRAFADSVRFTGAFKPDVLVTFGGYIGFMPSFTAKLAGRRLVLIEQNSVPGIANKALYPLSDLVILNYRHTLKWFRKGKVLGNPVDPSIGTADRREALGYFGLDPAKKTVLVIGGSQGAKALNEVLLASLAGLKEFNVLWAAGRNHFGEVRSRLEPGLKHVVLKDFIERMDLAWAAADLAVCRAGASTLSEMRKAKVPAVLVPFPYATEDHQYFNAREQEENGLAKVIREADLTVDGLIKAVRAMAADLGVYTQRFAAIDESGVNDRIVDAILKISPGGV